MTFNLAKSAHRLEALPRPQFAIASIAAILLIGVLDHLTGPITSLTIFYLTRLNHFGGRMPYNDDVTLVVLSRRMCEAVPQAAIL